MKKINIKNNNENVIKPQKITLINEKQEKYSFTERTKLKAIVKKIINGFRIIQPDQLESNPINLNLT